MTFAEDETFNYIRRHHSNFCNIHVKEILPYLHCLTTSDQDELRAHYDRWGNQHTLWPLFNSLRRRRGWVDIFIEALKICEWNNLADEVATVYQNNQPQTPSRAAAPQHSPSAPAGVPGPSIPAAAPSVSHNGYPEEEPSFPTPVQETQLPKSLGENSKKAPQTPSSGALPSRPGDSLEPSSDMAAPSPQPHGGLQEQDTGADGTHAAGVVPSYTSIRGPVSPTVSFQPLARSTPRASRLPGPAASAPNTGTSSPSAGLPSAGGAGDQVGAPISSTGHGTGVSTNSVTASTVVSKGPPTTAGASTVPSKLPTSSKTPRTTNVLTNLAPSKLPVNSAHVGTIPSKVPSDLVSDYKMPMSTVPTKVPATKSSSRPAKETPASPVSTDGAAGGCSPCRDHSSSRQNSGPELSKPDVLVSRLDSQPFSGCTEDLAISYSDSFDAGPDNAPEENEYMSVDTIRIHVAEDPSADLSGGNPGPCSAPEPQEEKLPGVWASWVSRLWAGALVVALLALLYQRQRLLQ